MNKISFDKFKNIEIRVGTIVEVQDFPEAKKAAYKLKINLGEVYGEKQSSAQITHLYSKFDLLGKQVLVVINLPPKNIGSYVSECLVTGFELEYGNVVLATTDNTIPNGTLLT